MTPPTLEFDVHIERCGQGARKGLAVGPPPSPPTGRIPQVARLMALAIHLDGLIRDGVIADYAAAARQRPVRRPQRAHPVRGRPRVHCHEAALIVKEFAGDWYSKNKFEAGITERQAANFASYCLKKLGDELVVRGERYG